MKKSILYFFTVFFISTLAMPVSYGIMRLGIELNLPKKLMSRIEWVPKHFKELKECLESWHVNDDDGGILAETPALTNSQCQLVTDTNRIIVSYNTGSGKICIRITDQVPGYKNNYITCEPYIDGNGNASFLYCSCKHNIPYTMSTRRLTDGEVSPFLETLGISNCSYDSTINSCD